MRRDVRSASLRIALGTDLLAAVRCATCGERNAHGWPEPHCETSQPSRPGSAQHRPFRLGAFPSRPSQTQNSEAAKSLFK